jgi:type IV pilus assembly protein PilY1
MESYVFVGANDGMLHAFRDSDGTEVWGFIPPDLLPTLKLLLDSDTDHDYYVDGPPVVYERWDDDGDGVIEANEVKNLLFFGERRGGEYYYALDISNPTTPHYQYIVTPYHLRADDDKDGVDDPLHTDADLGQSWVKPEKHTLFVDSDFDGIPDSGETVDVFLMGGGYDENQDFEPPAATDSVGRAVFAIQVDDTDGNSNADVKYLNFNGANYAAMTHSIIDISGFDRKGDGYMDTVYAGDLGGHIFAFRDSEPGETDPPDPKPYAYDGVWEKRKLFELPTSPVTLGGQSVTLGLKFMYAPDAVTEFLADPTVTGGFAFGDYLFIGTGDRTHPASTDFTDALYAIKNRWTPLAAPFTTITINDLYDATANLVQVGTPEEQETALGILLDDVNNKGWFIRMENDGEKVVSSPRVYAGVVYFTTYEPPTGVVSGDDPCAVPTERGTARVYALDYKTGAAAIDFSEDGNLTTADRSLVVGTSIPSAPVITVMQDGVKIFVGVQGGVKSLTPKASTDVHMYYWRQVF